MTVFKVDGETNTDDLSPATHATTRPDIPLHALAMLETRDPNGLKTIAKLKESGHPVAYVGDVVGTGSSRKVRSTPFFGIRGMTFPTCQTNALEA